MSRYDYSVNAPIRGYDAWKTQGPEEEEGGLSAPGNLVVEVIYDPTAALDDYRFQIVFSGTSEEVYWDQASEDFTEYVDVEDIPPEVVEFREFIEDLLRETTGKSFDDFESIEWSWSIA